MLFRSALPLWRQWRSQSRLPRWVPAVSAARTGILALIELAQLKRQPVQAANTDLCQLVAAAADLCRKPLRHGVLLLDQEPEGNAGPSPLQDCCLRLEARLPDGQRQPLEDLELELFHSGSDLNLTLAWCCDDARPLLWQGSHPVWMNAQTGERCARPDQGTPLEHLARRLRSLLTSVE